MIEEWFEAGTYYIFVDGWNRSAGNYVLNIWPMWEGGGTPPTP
jgi:hypothetical protein